VLVTLAQLAPRPRDVSANTARAHELLIANEHTDLLVLPELFLSSYVTTDVEELAVRLDGPEVTELREAAGETATALIVGLAEGTASGVANSAVFIEPSGELAGAYRKTHLFGAERDAYVPGDELLTVELGERTLGPMVCFDMEFPEVPRALAARGADLLVTISANPAQFDPDHAVFARARALENGLPHVYVNRVGEQDGVRFDGNSIAIDPDGKVVAQASSDGEDIVVTEIGTPGRRDSRTRYAEQLRPPLYAPAARA
jgi:predicted amidohydrolase